MTCQGCCGLLTDNKLPIPLQGISVDVQVKGFVADVSATLKYKNKEEKAVEAVFVFPMDEDSAVYSFEATIEGKTIVADLKEKQQAQETFDEAIKQGQQAFLLQEDESSGDVFSCSVGNLPPGQEAEVTLKYVVELSVEADGAVRFVLPAVLNPRYTPKGEKESVTATLPLVPISEIPYSLSLEAQFQSAYGINKIESTCDITPIQYTNDDQTEAKVVLAENHKFDRDVEILVYYNEVNKPSVSLESGLPDAGEGSFMSYPIAMLNFYPSFPVGQAQSKCGEFIFVVDRSGSMELPMNSEPDSPIRIQSAKETLVLLLKSLPLGCYFNIYSFGSTFESVFMESMEYTQETLQAAVDKVNQMSADLGGTEILEPLLKIYKTAGRSQHPRQVFILTDGEVGNTLQVIATVKQNSRNHRCFTFGIGEGASTALIKGVARAAGGNYDFITGNDRLQPKVLKALKCALQPTLKEISLNWTLPPDVEQNLVSPAPSVIFQGQRSIIYTQFKGKLEEENEVWVSLQYNYKDEIFTNELQFPLKMGNVERPTIHRLAAKNLISSLESEEESEEAKKKILETSLQSGVVSSLTAYVAVNKDTKTRVKGPPVQRFIPPVALACSFMPPPTSVCYYSAPVPMAALAGPVPILADCVMEACDSDSNLTVELAVGEGGFSPADPFDHPRAVVVPPPATVETPALYRLIALQKADGSWEATTEFANILGIPENFAESCPVSDMEVPVWVTILAVIWLHSSCPNENEEWELLEGKAVSWVKDKAGMVSLIVTIGTQIMQENLPPEQNGSRKNTCPHFPSKSVIMPPFPPCCGLIIVASRQPVPLQGISVDVQVTGFVADVSATLKYKNKEEKAVEAVFVFPMDEDSAVYSFEATIEGKKIVADLQEKKEAHKTYDEAISRGEQAFLLEEDESSADIFSCSVGNLPPGQDAEVTIKYVRELPVEADGAVRFVLPAVLNPRYTPKDQDVSITATRPQVPIGEIPYTLSLSAHFQSVYGIAKIESNCNINPLEYTDSDKTSAKVSLAEGHKFQRDVELLAYYTDVNKPSVTVEAGLATTESGPTTSGSIMAESMAMLNFYPSFPVVQEQSNCGEFIFLVDRSGSMECSMNSEPNAPQRIQSAKETLVLLLKSLPLGCYFNIYGFGSHFEAFFPESVEYTQQSMEEAVKKVNEMDASFGGTEILQPLKKIYQTAGRAEHPRQLFVFTDGEVGNTKQVIDEVQKNAQKHRCFTFGIGEGASTSLIKGMARAGSGTFEFITGKDRMQPKVLRALKCSLQPTVKDVSLTWTLPSGVEAIVLSKVPTAIFQGQRSIVYAQLKGKVEGDAEGGVCLQYKFKDEIVKNDLHFPLKVKNAERPTIHRLAAKALISELEHGTESESEEVKKKILETSLQSGVVSSLTAYVAVNKDTKTRVEGPPMRRDLPAPALSFGYNPSQQTAGHVRTWHYQGKRCAVCLAQVASAKKEGRLVNLIRQVVQETCLHLPQGRGPDPSQEPRRAHIQETPSMLSSPGCPESDSEESTSDEDDPEGFEFSLLHPFIKTVKKALKWEEPVVEPCKKKRFFKNSKKTTPTFPFLEEVKEMFLEEWQKIDKRAPYNRVRKLYLFKAEEVTLLENAPQVDVALLQLAKHVTLPLEDTVSFKDILDRKIESDLKKKKTYLTAGAACKPALALTSVSKALEEWAAEVEDAVLRGSMSAETPIVLKDIKLALASWQKHR
ncbi:uncharacterized protein ACMZJ9_008764 [Mantella aurantiaca]